MKLIECLVWYLEKIGATDVRILDYSILDFIFSGEKFELLLDSLLHRGSLTTAVFDEELMEDEGIDVDDLRSVINELSKHSENVSYFYEQEEGKVYARYAFSYTNPDELMKQVMNGCHALIIAKDVFFRVASGSRVDAHLDWTFIYGEEEEATYRHIKEHLNINILYVHGFRSSGASETAERLRRLLPHCKVVAPDLPTNARKAVELLKALVETEKIDVVVGTSMGGMLAQKLRGVAKVLVNPSFFVSETFRKNIGMVSYFSEREDGAKEFEITPEIVESYVEAESGQFRSISQKEKDITVGAFGTKDDVVNCQDDYMAHYENIVYFAGGHRLDEDALKERIIPAIAAVYRNKSPFSNIC